MVTWIVAVEMEINVTKELVASLLYLRSEPPAICLPPHRILHISSVLVRAVSHTTVLSFYLRRVRPQA